MILFEISEPRSSDVALEDDDLDLDDGELVRNATVLI